MPLTLIELLRDTTLGLQLVAGKDGVDSRGPVTWVHSSELPDPSKWLTGGEALLTTGFGIRRSTSTQRRLVARLDEVGCVAIGLGLGDWLQSIPGVMIEEANRRALPLFTVPYSTPFSVVTRRVAERIFEEQYSAPFATVDPRRHLLAQVVLGPDVATIVQGLAQVLAGCSIIAFNFCGEPLARSRTGSTHAASLWQSTASHRRFDRFTMRRDDGLVTGIMLRVNELREGMLVVVSRRRLNNEDLVQVEQAASSLSLALRYSASPRLARQQRFSELLRDVYDMAFVPDALHQRLAQWAMELNGKSLVIAVSLHNAAPLSRAATALEDALAAQALQPFVGVMDRHVWAVVPASIAIEELRRTLVEAELKDASIGTSRPIRDAIGLKHALDEAHLAVMSAEPGAVAAIEALALSGLVPRLRSDTFALQTLRSVLAPLQRSDAANDSQLLATLHAYVEHGFRPGETAKSLNIHRHTLGYRLHQIARLTQRDLRNGDHLSELTLALRLIDEPRRSGTRSAQSRPRRRRG